MSCYTKKANEVKVKVLVSLIGTRNYFFPISLRRVEMAIYALRAAPLFHSPSAVSLDALDFPPRSYTFNNTSVHAGERPCGLHCEYETV